jgi:hypothetical protein
MCMLSESKSVYLSLSTRVLITNTYWQGCPLSINTEFYLVLLSEV